MVDGADPGESFWTSIIGLVGVLVVASRHGKVRIVLLQVLGQPGVGGILIADTRQAQGLDQAILKRLEQAFYPTFGLWAQGLDGGNSQGFGGTLKLRGFGVFWVVFGEDAVPIAVERHGAAMSRDIGL